MPEKEVNKAVNLHYENVNDSVQDVSDWESESKNSIDSTINLAIKV